jgi:signal transduction histidine kinase
LLAINSLEPFTSCGDTLKNYIRNVSTTVEMVDHLVIARIRCALAIIALLATMMSSYIFGKQTPAVLILFYAYAIHSVVLYVATTRRSTAVLGNAVQWLDVGWCALMLFIGNADSHIFLFFFFAIIASAFLHGYTQAWRLTVVCAIILFLSQFDAVTVAGLAKAIFVSAFALGVGYMVCQWGQTAEDRKRKMALLVNVNRLSNPRFGVDHTINNIMQLTVQFYGASSCILVLRDGDQAPWSIRTANAGQISSGARPQPLSDSVAFPIMAFETDQITFFSRRFRFGTGWSEQMHVKSKLQQDWGQTAPATGRAVGDLLSADSFISAPVPLRSGAGRLYIVADALDKADAEFLSEISAQAFPVIENIYLLDRLASDAAHRERQKMAHDLHDSLLQPYLGLSHALRAIWNKIDPDNPLLPDIRKLSDMVGHVIADLRHLTGAIRHRSDLDETAFVVAMRVHTDQLKQFYGLDIAVHVDAELGINDRMASEIFQIVCEATSNIRKHTAATHGSVKLRCVQGWLNLRIENEHTGGADRDFMPRSISERAAALGGITCVERLSSGATAVRVDIPV